MLSLKTLSGSNTGNFGHSNNLAFNSACGTSTRLSLFSQKAFVSPLRYRFNRDAFSGDGKGLDVEKERKVERNVGDVNDQRRRERGISGIHVPRQKYISVSKTELVQAILEMFELKDDADNFLKLSASLDSILHAEHKGILEEMRSYYSPNPQDQTQRPYSLSKSWEATSGRLQVVSDGSIGTNGNETNCLDNPKVEKPLDNFDLGRFFESLSGKGDRKSALDSPRIAVAIHFQQSFMKLLHNAQFEELSAQDLLLTNALNSDYLLTLPIYVDWKRASESNVIIFRRGYATERQSGLLIAEKLDYLQSTLLQEIFFNLSRPLKEFGKWLYEAKLLTKNYSQQLMGTCFKRDLWKQCLENVEDCCVSLVFKINSSVINQEPAFEELILLYTDELSQTEDMDDVLPLHLKIYERIPIPDLPVIFPHKKLSFRILDTVRLDVASILGLLAFFLNYKFEDILSSPSAVMLDVIASTALILYVSRVILGYKQTWDRYQLLVNKTLYEKTLASGFGSVHFLLDESELEQVLNRKSIGSECEMFLLDKFNVQIDMPIDKAMDTLVRLGIVSEFPVEGNLKPKAIPCSKAYEHLRKRWDSLLHLES